MTPPSLLKMDIPRTVNALKIESAGKITLVRPEVYDVQSQSKKAKVYRVNMRFVTCSCEDYMLRGVKCKHILAVKLHLERGKREARSKSRTRVVEAEKTKAQHIADLYGA